MGRSPESGSVSLQYGSMKRRARTRFLIVAGLIVGMLGCAGKQAPRTAPAVDGYSEKGLASWYGPKYHGRTTASGEPYDMHELTAAHRTLPFGVVVEVIDLDTRRKVRVRINDRGPFVEGRIIDLSYAAARQLGIVEQGMARVRIVVVDRGSRRG
jgi:rare lipoprotein A